MTYVGMHLGYSWTSSVLIPSIVQVCILPVSMSSILAWWFTSNHRHTISPEPTEWFISGNQPQLLPCGCRMFTQAFPTALQIIRLQLLPILHKQPQLHTYC